MRASECQSRFCPRAVISLLLLCCFILLASANPTPSPDSAHVEDADTRAIRASGADCTLPKFDAINNFVTSWGACVSRGALKFGESCAVKCAPGYSSPFGPTAVGLFQCTPTGLRTPAPNFVCRPPVVNGGWSAWTATSTCSVTCGKGSLSQSRACNNPAPQNGGAQCVGPNTRVIPCTMKPCPVNGGWSDWINFGTCSLTCGGGTQVQKRTCTKPAPQFGGAQCVGNSTQNIPCNAQPCPPPCPGAGCTLVKPSSMVGTGCGTFWVKDDTLIRIPQGNPAGCTALTIVGGVLRRSAGGRRLISGTAPRFTKVSPTAFAGFSAMTQLELSSNGGIVDIPDGVFSGMTSLGRLEISYNRFTTMRSSWFTGLTSLTTLVSDYGKMANIQDNAFASLPALQILSMSGNLLTGLSPGWFNSLPATLEELFIAQSPLQSIPDNSFSKLSNLETLDLAQTLLRTVGDRTFSGLSGLTTLSLGMTFGTTNSPLSISDHAFDMLKNLKELWIPDRNLTAVKSSWFAGMGATLQNLDLSTNRINPALSVGAFANLKVITTLSLGGSGLNCSWALDPKGGKLSGMNGGFCVDGK